MASDIQVSPVVLRTEIEPTSTSHTLPVVVYGFNGRPHSRHRLRLVLDSGASSEPNPERDLAEGRFVRHESSEAFLSSLRERISD